MTAVSRTDKTRPVSQKIKDHPVEWHDHIDGVCELLADPRRQREYGPGTSRNQCYLDAQWWRPEYRCCCASCNWPTDGKRRRRREAKRQTRNWEKDYE